jgi:hypothetical protein
MLTDAITVQNGTRLMAGRPQIDDDANIMSVPIELRTPNASTTPSGGMVLSRHTLTIRNGMSDGLTRNTAPAAGMEPQQLLIYQPSAVSTPTGFDQAYAAFKGGANAGASRVALEGVMRTLQIFNQTTLAGS